jgi:hypothetical protein
MFASTASRRCGLEDAIDATAFSLTRVDGVRFNFYTVRNLQ